MKMILSLWLPLILDVMGFFTENDIESAQPARFSTSSAEEMTALIKSTESTNTRKATIWALVYFSIDLHNDRTPMQGL
jgi:hypothetical protein